MTRSTTPTTLVALVALLALVALALLPSQPVAAQSSFRIVGVVWTDTNCDGIRQDDEPLKPHVRMMLRWAGGNGVIDATDREIEDGGSAASGQYAFTLAGAGEPYFISIRTADRPLGFTLSPFQQGGDPTRDSDMRDDLLPGTTLWATPVFVMPEDGSQITGVDIGLCPLSMNNQVFIPLVTR
ncbi:MAG: SdrD B-like domain-containing protein [Oscillochloridaceae bacterium umkhey_bin13]